MKKNHLFLLTLFAVAALAAIFLTSFAGNRHIKLSGKQMDAISIVVENREQWNDVWCGFSHFGLANRGLMWEKDGQYYFSGGYTEDTDKQEERLIAGKGQSLSFVTYCLPCCYRIDWESNTLVPIRYGSKDLQEWLMHGQVFDPETVTESELTEILAESYKAFLEKNNKN